MIFRNIQCIIASLFIILSLISCKTITSASPSTSITPLIPAPQPLSVITIPIEFKLQPYFDLAEKQVDKTFKGNEHPCEGVSYDYVFIREPLDWSGKDQQIVIGLDGKYSLDMTYCAQCIDLFSEKGNCAVPRIPFSCGIGEPMRRMHTEFTSRFAITETYGITTKTNVTELKAIDPCKVTVFSYDATHELMKKMRATLEKTAIDMDKDLSKMHFRKEAQEAWDIASEVIDFSPYGYMYFQPENVSITQPTIKKNILYTQLELSAKPVFSSIKSAALKSTVPDLNVKKKSTSDSLYVYLDLKLDYDSISIALQPLLSGKKIELDKKRFVIIDSVKVFGASNDQLLFQIKFSGSKKGSLFLKGTPSIDRSSQVLRFNDLDYELETKSILLKTAKWLFNEKILEEFTKASTQDLKPYLNDAKKSINEKFKFRYEGYQFEGKLNTIEIHNVYPSTHFLWIRTYTSGKAQLKN
jgi:hypothetical protein